MLLPLLLPVFAAGTRPLRLCEAAKVLTISITTNEHPEDTTWGLRGLLAGRGAASQTTAAGREYGMNIITVPTRYASGFVTPTYEGGEPFTTYEVRFDRVCRNRRRLHSPRRPKSKHGAQRTPLVRAVQEFTV